MTKIIQNPAHGRDIARHTRCRLVMASQDSFNLVALISFKDPCVFLNRNALSPLDVDHLDIQLMPLTEIDPEVRDSVRKIFLRSWKSGNVKDGKSGAR